MLPSPAQPRQTPRTLQQEIGKKKPFDVPEEEAFLNIMRTHSILAGEAEQFLKAYGLSESAYNALRILRGAGEKGRMCHEIGDDLVARVPDVTRLVDRLERDGLAERARCSEDRRVVHVRITAKGLELLARIDRPLIQLHEQQLGHMSRKDLAALSALLVKARYGPSRPGAGVSKVHSAK